MVTNERCPVGLLEAPEQDFAIGSIVTRAEWFYELREGYKHSFFILQTASGDYYVTEKDPYGVHWNQVPVSDKRVTPYNNLKGFGNTPDEVRFFNQKTFKNHSSINNVVLHYVWSQVVLNFESSLDPAQLKKLGQIAVDIQVTVGDLKI